MLLIKPLTGIVLSLGPTEMFVIILWGLTLIATLSGAYMTRSLLIGVAGLLVGTVGMSTIGTIRGTFGSPYLLRSEEHTSELQSLMRISYAVFCLKKKITT